MNILFLQLNEIELNQLNELISNHQKEQTVTTSIALDNYIEKYTKYDKFENVRFIIVNDKIILNVYLLDDEYKYHVISVTDKETCNKEKSELYFVDNVNCEELSELTKPFNERADLNEKHGSDIQDMSLDINNLSKRLAEFLEAKNHAIYKVNSRQTIVVDGFEVFYLECRSNGISKLHYTTKDVLSCQ